ncbi:MAG: helix-turn-helix transcriptional regulator [Leptospiraceae bacterium]|nr:helix-turn-helix transcriptional regulator [Leptospiraceae bacterium]NUM41345.1 helix-turn-helix transcriptional regulator [Leptospiraceae bacterium]
MPQGNRLKSVIEKSGLNQSEFAETLGITQSAISQYLSDKRSFDKPLALAIQFKHKVNANWLLTGEGSMEAGSVEERLAALNEGMQYTREAKKNPQVKELFDKILNLSHSEREKLKIVIRDILGK